MWCSIAHSSEAPKQGDGQMMAVAVCTRRTVLASRVVRLESDFFLTTDGQQMEVASYPPSTLLVKQLQNVVRRSSDRSLSE